ncbi:MAG TPA: NFACT RNA binding domain-containing protein [Candidatus Baltobacteraceae bacterium]|nr:NFACT RNA binding domain-containing protein [Candidatus Baltobacteraceae bacterium]
MRPACHPSPAVLTDWLLFERLAAELDAALRGSRILAAGLTIDGRSGLRTAAGTLVIDAFAETPFITLEAGTAVAASAGWARALGDFLSGLRITGIRARRGDRLIAIDCAATSRFGVASGYRIVAELVPRFGNVLLLKGDTVVAAAKEFAGGLGRRTIERGGLYEPPPLPRGALDGAALSRLPRALAESLTVEAESRSWPEPGEKSRWLEERAAEFLQTAPPGSLNEVFAYRDGAGRLVAAHLFALAQFAELKESREAALLPLVAEALAERRAGDGIANLQVRRAALVARIGKRSAAVRRECELLERERDDEAGRDALRQAGDALYEHAEAVPARATRFVPPGEPARSIELDPERDAKSNARNFFKRYKKSVARARHAVTRLSGLARDVEALDELLWEAQRSDAETIDEIAEEFARFEPGKSARAKASRVRGRALGSLEVKIAQDARILVGRSPRNNAELTFRIARPDDLWFHVRGSPGAHVILRIDSEREPTSAELTAAAQLAALHSKARGSLKVPVDYTARKHVRRRAGGAPGHVWYTDAQTIVVTPKDGAEPSET